MLKIPAKYEKNTASTKFTPVSRQISPALRPDVSAGYCQRTLVDKSVMIRTQMIKRNETEMVVVLGKPCVIPPRNINSNSN
jgi:hypothetical protein